MLGSATSFHPFVHLVPLEPLELLVIADAVCENAIPFDPLGHNIIANAKVFATLSYRQSALFNLVYTQNSTGVLICGHVHQRLNGRMLDSPRPK